MLGIGNWNNVRAADADAQNFYSADWHRICCSR